jgi:hypothetical protein
MAGEDAGGLETAQSAELMRGREDRQRPTSSAATSQENSLRRTLPRKDHVSPSASTLNTLAMVFGGPGHCNPSQNPT